MAWTTAQSFCGKDVASHGNLGRVGEIQDVDLRLLRALFAWDSMPVISPVSFGAYDAKSYNVNADHVGPRRWPPSWEPSVSSLSAMCRASSSPIRVVRAITADQAEAWIADGNIFGGMACQSGSAIEAVRQGVASGDHKYRRGAGGKRDGDYWFQIESGDSSGGWVIG